jgi:L-asparaginase / beta-aspartyl-peptidase
MRKRNYSLVFLLCLQVCWLNMMPIDAQNRSSHRVADADAGAVQPVPAARPQFMFAIHGGAGAIERSKMTPELEKEYRAKLTEALEAGYRILDQNGTALDAVEAAIKIMEDSPLFNAGKGAVFTSAGTNELDASIMDGRTLMAGSVAGLKHIKNPISLARMVMEKSPHVMMAGAGAETFAKQQGVQLVPQSYFYTERRWKEWRAKVEEERSKQPKKTSRLVAPLTADEDRHGTVGAVALDRAGNLAAGTSTGGITNKKFGRIGDSPIIGAGTYANNQTCAVSATGDGEFFIRSVVAHDISALVGYKGMSVKDAADTVLDKVKQLGGTGGVIVLDREGHVAMSFNTAGMYRGFIGPDGKVVIEIYKD